MEIEAHLVEIENPFAAAWSAFEELVQELSGVKTQKKTHSELENRSQRSGDRSYAPTSTGTPGGKRTGCILDSGGE